MAEVEKTVPGGMLDLTAFSTRPFRKLTSQDPIDSASSGVATAMPKSVPKRRNGLDFPGSARMAGHYQDLLNHLLIESFNIRIFA
jgi:hypothetical protein